MNQNLPETDLHSRIQGTGAAAPPGGAGASRLAQRNLALQQELEAMAALNPQMELHENPAAAAAQAVFMMQALVCRNRIRWQRPRA